MPAIQTQLIYCGDNLQKLRELPESCADLIYIDPPFNSNRNYEVFWGDTQERRAFDDRFGAVEHYIFWMRPRVMEMYRVLKPTGSFYYHCDWHADAYVRVMLDEVFGADHFNTHVIWRRINAKGLAFRSFPNNHDSIFFYTKGPKYTFNRQYLPHDPEYIRQFYKYVEPDTGRRYRLADLTNPNKDRPNLTYEFMGVTRVWRWTKGRMEKALADGIVVQSKPGAVPALKRYLDEQEGTPVDSIWSDIPPIQPHTGESLGYPTQKPLALLDRIIRASSNQGDVVLDAFCGCGTTLVAAQMLKRKWIGIDISPTACHVMGDRLAKACNLREGKDFWLRDIPKTADELRKYPHSEFENWAVTALNTVISGGQAIANRAQVGDMGIDGRIYPVSVVKEKKGGSDLFGPADRWFPVQVKQKDKAGRPDMDAFETAMQRQRREKGFFVAFGYSRDAQLEIKRAAREHNLEIIPITVQEILDEEVHFRV
jgi:site-specific DNA-methyltransferase (adenine-specific)